MEGGDRYTGELGELRLQLKHFVVGSEAINDFMTRLSLYPEYKARHDDDSPVTEDGGYVTALGLGVLRQSADPHVPSRHPCSCQRHDQSHLRLRKRIVIVPGFVITANKWQLAADYREFTRAK